MNWTHDGLMNDLAKHLLGKSDRMIWRDMQLGPVGSPRPDVFTIARSYSRPTPLAYECKISVADFRSDVTSGKWQTYLKFAAGVIFAVPAGLIDKKEIPQGCGLIVRSESGWRMAKGPTLAPVKLPQDTLLKLLIDGAYREGFSEIKQERFNLWRAERKVAAKFGEATAKIAKDVHAMDKRVEEAQAKAKEILGRARQDAADIIKYERDRQSNLESERIRLCSLLVLEPESDWSTVVNRARSIRNAIKQSEEVSRMRSMLRDIKWHTSRILDENEDWLTALDEKKESKEQAA